MAPVRSRPRRPASSARRRPRRRCAPAARAPRRRRAGRGARARSPRPRRARLEVAVRLDDAADRLVPVLGLRRELELGDARVAALAGTTTTSDGPAGKVDRDVARDVELRLVHVRARPARRSCRRADARHVGERRRSPAGRRSPTPRRARAAAPPRDEAGAVRRRADDDPLDARHQRGHGAHDERRDEAARDVDPDRVERDPAALELDAGRDLEADDPRAAAPRASGAPRRRARARLLGHAAVGSARAGSTPSSRSAHSRTASSPRARTSSTIRRRSLIRASARPGRGGSTTRPPPRAPAAAARRRRRGRGVHRDHARLGERQDARRARARDERADRVERVLGRVEHEVARRRARRRRCGRRRRARRAAVAAPAARRAPPRTRAATPTERRPFVRSVLPLETRSTIASASPSRGASSTEPVTRSSSTSSPRSAAARARAAGRLVATRAPSRSSSAGRPATPPERRPRACRRRSPSREQLVDVRAALADEVQRR